MKEDERGARSAKASKGDLRFCFYTRGARPGLWTFSATPRSRKKEGTESSAAPPAGRMLSNGTMAATSRNSGYSVHHYTQCVPRKTGRAALHTRLI